MRKSVAIVGGGPSGLILADKLDKSLFDVTIYDRNLALGRKFLVAGKGGLNITHGEDIEIMKSKYTNFKALQDALTFFTNEDLRGWLLELGVETYSGSSSRVFPVKKTKPIKVFKSILNHIEVQGVKIVYAHTWVGFDTNNLVFIDENNNQTKTNADITVFALGGGSWKVTGSKGEWLTHFENKNIKTKKIEASNAAFGVNWNSGFIKKYEGTPVKNIHISFNNYLTKGEIVISKFGIEGGPIYALSKPLRESLNLSDKPTISINFKPTMKREAIIRKLKESKKRNSWSEHIIWKLKLSRNVFALLRDQLSKEDFLDPDKIADALQAFHIKITDIASVEEAISTVGGINLDEVSDKFELKKLPGTYVIGEMLDWDAPTGGYLLQGCFSMGAYLAYLLNKN